MRFLLPTLALCLLAPYGYAETTNESPYPYSMDYKTDREDWTAIRLRGGKIISETKVFACGTLDQYDNLFDFHASGEGEAPKADECQLLMGGAEVELTQPNNPVCAEGVCEFRLEGWWNFVYKPFFLYWAFVDPHK